MENAFRIKKDEFKKKLIEFVIIHNNEMNPVFISKWKGEVEIGYRSQKYGFKLLSLVGDKVQNIINLISPDMQKEINVMFESIYNKKIL